MVKKALRGVLFAFIAAYFLYLLSLPIKKSDFYQWDFKTYYYAGQAFAEGLNPYGLTALSQVAGYQVQFRFRYPPITLPLFRAFSLFNYRSASILFLALKVLFLAGLFVLWKRYFLVDRITIWFLVFAVFAFNTAIFIDIVAGNISIFEQFGLWLAFVFFLKRKYSLFCVLILMLSMVKITPIFFLVLLLASNEKKRFWYCGGTGLAFASVYLLTALFSPYWEDFKVFGLAIERNAQSFYSLLRFDLDAAARSLGLAPPPFLGQAVFVCFAAAVLLTSCRAAVALRSRPAQEKNTTDLHLIFLSCLAYALIIPRFPGYSHIILIVPVYYILKNYLAGTEGLLLALLAILYLPKGAAMPGMELPLELFWKYQAVFVALLVWGLFVGRILRAKKTA